MKKAYVVDDIAVEVIPSDASFPNFSQEQIDQCSEEVPDHVFIGSIRDENGVWPGGPEPKKPACPTVSPVEFKLLFTSAERIAIKAARETDPIVEDFYSIVEDPRLTQVDLKLQSTQSAIDYLIAQNLVNADRKFSILNGELQ